MKSKISRYGNGGAAGLIGFVKSQAFAVIMFTVIATIIVTGINNTAESSRDEELRMAKDSIRRAVVSCYAVEGRYPDSYEYLKEKYGLTVDDEKYIVHYEIFASNIMPEITVIAVE